MRANKRRFSKQDYELLAAFRYALRRFLRFSETAAEATGLKPRQHQALLAIKGFPGRNYVTVGELAERLQLMHHSVVGLANRLGKEDLIERKRNPHDRRQVYLKLTRRGESVLEDLSSIHHRELQKIAIEIQPFLDQMRRFP